MPGTTERPGQRFLIRDRVNGLLRDASRHFLTTVIADPKAGKTIAVSDYARTSGSTVLWVEVTPLDSLRDHLWATLLRVMEPALPELAAALSALPYTPTPRLAADFLSLWRQHTTGMSSIMLIFDRVQLLNSLEPFRFLHCLLAAELRNLRIFVLSDHSAHWNLHGLVCPGSLYCLTGNLLAFSTDEVEALLRMRKISHAKDEVSHIMECTGGWAFAVEQMVSQLSAGPPSAHDDAAPSIPDGYPLLRFHMPEKARELLTRLALLPSFSDEILHLMAASANPPLTLGDLRTHFFASYAGGQELCHLQPFYQRQFATMAQSLDAGEIERVCGLAGDWFLSRQYTYEALVCFQKGGQSEKLIAALQENSQAIVDPRITAFLRQHHANLSLLWAEESPMMRARLANLWMRFLAYDDVPEILRFPDACEDATHTGASRRALGEAHLCIAKVALYHADPQAIGHIHQAYTVLEEESLFPRDQLILPGESLIMQAQCTADVLQATLALHEQILPYAGRLFPHSFRSFSALYEAEIAYSVFVTRHAFHKADEAIRMAMEDGQHILVCNAYVLLARIAVVDGSYGDIREVIARFDACVQQHSLREMQALCAYLRGWMFLRLDALDAVPENIGNPLAFLQMPKKMLTCSEMLVHCEYWMRVGEYERAQHMIEQGSRAAEQKHLWLPHISFGVLRAVCHFRRGDTEAALQALLTAYEKAQPAHIVAPFIEQGEVMRSLLNAARRAGTSSGMDEAWLSLVYTKANAYDKSIRTIRQQFSQQQQRSSTPLIKLSSREKEVLTMICAGLTRQQMGAELGITVHGVKRHITSLYNKLGALNRAHAIRLATIMGLLHGEEGA